MATFDLTHGDIGGVQIHGLPAKVVNFSIDFAELYKKFPAYVSADLIKIGILKKGMIVLGAAAEVIKKCTTATVAVVSVKTDAAVAIIDAIAPDAVVGTSTMAAQAAGKYFDVVAANKLLAADLGIMVSPGAVVPQDGILEVRFLVAQLANF